MKKLLCLALVLCMALSLLPTAALADDHEKQYGPFTYYEYEDELAVTILDVDSSVTGTLTIPEKIAGRTVKSSMVGAFSDLPYITELVIPKTFQYFAIADSINPFYGCTSLRKVTVAPDHPSFRFADGLLYSKTNAGATVLEGVLPCLQGKLTVPAVTFLKMGALQGCKLLTDVVLPEGLEAIGWLAFAECTALKTLYIPASCTEFGMSVFDGCDALTDIYFGGTEQQWNKLTENGYNWIALRSDVRIHFNAKPSGFRDVAPGDYFAKPVEWAVQKGITDGTSETTFSPNDPCTRGQMVTFLWRAMGSPEPDSARNPFRDVKTDDYFCKAVLWAVENGITDGTGADTFSPNDKVTRAQTVTFLWRLADPGAVSAKNPFRDVPSGAYYTDAVLWAVKEGITDGTAEHTFSPDDSCTRAQIVTFLYRDLA